MCVDIETCIVCVSRCSGVCGCVRGACVSETENTWSSDFNAHRCDDDDDDDDDTDEKMPTSASVGAHKETRARAHTNNQPHTHARTVFVRSHMCATRAPRPRDSSVGDGGDGLHDVSDVWRAKHALRRIYYKSSFRAHDGLGFVLCVIDIFRT